MTKACCILACQASPPPQLFLRGQGSCLRSLGQRHFGLFACKTPATRGSSFGDSTPNFLWNSRVHRAGAVEKAGVKEVDGVRGFSGRDPGDCEGPQLWLGTEAGWEGVTSKSNLLLLSLGAPQKLVSGSRGAALSTPQLPEGISFVQKFKVENFELRGITELAMNAILEPPTFFLNCRLRAPSAANIWRDSREPTSEDTWKKWIKLARLKFSPQGPNSELVIKLRVSNMPGRCSVTEIHIQLLACVWSFPVLSAQSQIHTHTEA